MNSTEIIGRNIKRIREQNGIKQEMLAKHLGVGKSRMSQIENGDCEELSIKKIEKIAIYLKTDFFVLTQNDTNRSTNNNDISLNISEHMIQILADEIVKRMDRYFPGISFRATPL